MRPFLAPLLALLVLAPAAHALELGEPRLRARIGEALRIEIPLAGDGAENIAADCFQLGSNNNDLPTVSGARLRIKGSGPRRRLVIDQRQAIAEPLFALALHIGCGIEREQEFVFMPDPPPTRRETRAPAPLPDDTPPSARPLRRDPALRGDRLSLSASPPTPLVAPELADVEERMLRLETSLHSLREELEQVDKLIALRQEMLEAQKQLHASSPLPLAAAPPEAPAPRDDDMANWLQLLGGVLLGGLLSGLGVWQLERRRQERGRLP